MYREFVIDVTDVTHKNKLFRVKIDFQGECIEINANGKALASLPVLYRSDELCSMLT